MKMLIDNADPNGDTVLSVASGSTADTLLISIVHTDASSVMIKVKKTDLKNALRAFQRHA